MPDEVAADIITPDPPNAPTVGARPFWLPDTRGFLAGAIVILIFFIVLTLMWHPMTMEERIFNLFYLVLGILISTFKDVYNFSFSSTQAGEDKTKAIASLGASLANSVPASVAQVPVAPLPSADTPSTIIKP